MHNLVSAILFLAHLCTRGLIWHMDAHTPKHRHWPSILKVLWHAANTPLLLDLQLLTIYKPMPPLYRGGMGFPLGSPPDNPTKMRAGLCPFWKFAKKGLVKNCTTWFLQSCFLHIFVLGDWSDTWLHTHQNIGIGLSFLKFCDMQPTHHFSWICNFGPCIYPCPPPIQGGHGVPPWGKIWQSNKNEGRTLSILKIC